MSRTTLIDGSIYASTSLTPRQANAFNEIMVSNEMHLSFHHDAGTGTLRAANRESSWAGWRPRGYSYAEHKNVRHQPGYSMTFPELMSHIVSQPELENVNFNGEFVTIEEGDDLPKIRWVTISYSRVVVSEAVITRGQERKVEAPEVAVL